MLHCYCAIAEEYEILSYTLNPSDANKAEEYRKKGVEFVGSNDRTACMNSVGGAYDTRISRRNWPKCICCSGSSLAVHGI